MINMINKAYNNKNNCWDNSGGNSNNIFFTVKKNMQIKINYP